MEQILISLRLQHYNRRIKTAAETTDITLKRTFHVLEQNKNTSLTNIIYFLSRLDIVFDSRLVIIKTNYLAQPKVRMAKRTYRRLKKAEMSKFVKNYYLLQDFHESDTFSCRK